jgi:NAD+ synthase
MQIAVLGGSFDPPHNGHLLVAKEILRTLPIDEVWLIPCYSHPFEKRLSDPQHRLMMTKLLTSENIVVKDFEIAQKQISFSIDTLNALQKKYPRHTFSWIIGSDQVSEFPKWKQWKTIVRDFKLIIYPRLASNTQIQNLLDKTIPADLQKRVTLLHSPAVRMSQISSSTIRAEISDTKMLTLVPHAVARYIIKHQLYQKSGLSINPQLEISRITAFIKTVLKKTGKKNVVLAVSGGIDSATAGALLSRNLIPAQIHFIHLPYFSSNPDALTLAAHLNIPKSHMHVTPIQSVVDAIISQQKIPAIDTLRRGNLMARVRMLHIYDLAKRLDALVCGTENKSEYHLGYFTRFGDEASDFEPIQHLYKTQVYHLAHALSVPETIQTAAPTAGLWHGQTDETELGFSYTEADQVMHLFIDKRVPLQKIPKKDYPNAKAIIAHMQANTFKHHVPYTIDSLIAKSE